MTKSKNKKKDSKKDNVNLTIETGNLKGKKIRSFSSGSKAVDIFLNPDNFVVEKNDNEKAEEEKEKFKNNTSFTYSFNYCGQ